MNNLIVAAEKTIKQGTKAKLNGKLPFSSIKMDSVNHAFPLHPYTQDVKFIPEENIQQLYNYLTPMNECYREAGLSSELAVNVFINCVLVFVCGLFEGDVQIVTEDYLNGSEVLSQGSFEFVLKVGKKRVFIIEAKKRDVDEGIAQALVGCEAAAEIDQMDVVYGVVSTFREWAFLKSGNDIIQKDLSSELVMNLNGEIRMEGLRDVAGKLYSILSDLK